MFGWLLCPHFLAHSRCSVCVYWKVGTQPDVWRRLGLLHSSAVAPGDPAVCCAGLWSSAGGVCVRAAALG